MGLLQFLEAEASWEEDSWRPVVDREAWAVVGYGQWAVGSMGMRPLAASEGAPKAPAKSLQPTAHSLEPFFP